MGSSKLVDRLASLGLNVDADAFASAMRARPTRSYGGPSSKNGSTVSSRSAGLSNSKARNDAVLPSEAHISAAGPHSFSEPTQSHSDHTPAPELHPNPPSSPVQYQDSWAIISGEAAPDEPEDIVHGSSITRRQQQLSNSSPREPLPKMDDIASALSSLNLNLRMGQPAAVGQSFCPILALSKLPYKFMLNQMNLSDHVSKEFFADGKFWRRRWTVYFGWPMENAAKPTLLVPMQEVESLLTAINDKFRSANLSSSRLRDRHPGFSIVFSSKLARLRPRFLAVVSSYEEYTRLEMPKPGYLMPNEAKIPDPSMNDREVTEHDTQLSQALQLGANKKKKKGSSSNTSSAPREVPLRQTANAPRNYALEMEQVQRFLGLRPASAEAGKGVDTWQDSQPTWAEAQAEQATTDANENLDIIDVTKPVPFPFEKDVVFICVDVEAWEKDNSKITEIGICSLDTRQLAGQRPGKDGRNWFNKLASRHFRIQEHSHLRNGDFVLENAGNFKFGKSEMISLSNVPHTVAACFRPTPDADGTPRTVVVTGHDVNADIRFLRKIGYNVENLSTMHEPNVDTQNIYRALQGKKLQKSNPTQVNNAVGLSTILEEYDIPPFGLHNAGNDATYTLQAMLAMVIGDSVARARPMTASVEDWIGDVSASQKGEEKKEDPLDDLPKWAKADEDYDPWD